MENKGILVQIIGPVVDVRFTDTLPKIYNALKIKNKTTGTEIIAEVQQHLGNNTVRAVAMESTEGLTRGIEVVDRESYKCSCWKRYSWKNNECTGTSS